MVTDARATMALYRHDKDEFEKEIRQKYGNTRLEVVAPDATPVGEDEMKKKSRNRKKKKKRN